MSLPAGQVHLKLKSYWGRLRWPDRFASALVRARHVGASGRGLVARWRCCSTLVHVQAGGHLVEFAVGSAPDDGRSVELVAAVALGPRLVVEKVGPRPVADPAVVDLGHRAAVDGLDQRPPSRHSVVIRLTPVANSMPAGQVRVTLLPKMLCDCWTR